MNPLLEVLIDVWFYFKETRKIYLSLLIALLLLMGLVIVVAEGTAIMPFIYTIF
jgi:NAD/NADP transhydrogenase beta subunit